MRDMKRKFKKGLSLVLTALFMLVLPCGEVFAAEDVQNVDENIMVLDAEITDITEAPDVSVYATTFTEASITVSFSKDGMLVQIATGMNLEASVVGVKDIKIQKKGFFGWSTVSTSAGGESYNNYGSKCTVIYPGAVKGETYRVLCTHYANVDEYRELPNQSGEYKCEY